MSALVSMLQKSEFSCSLWLSDFGIIQITRDFSLYNLNTIFSFVIVRLRNLGSLTLEI